MFKMMTKHLGQGKAGRKTCGEFKMWVFRFQESTDTDMVVLKFEIHPS